MSVKHKFDIFWEKKNVWYSYDFDWYFATRIRFWIRLTKMKRIRIRNTDVQGRRDRIRPWRSTTSSPPAPPAPLALRDMSINVNVNFILTINFYLGLLKNLGAVSKFSVYLKKERKKIWDQPFLADRNLKFFQYHVFLNMGRNILTPDIYPNYCTDTQDIWFIFIF